MKTRRAEGAVLNVCSPSYDLAYSYGRLALELAAGLEALGAQVNRIAPDVSGGTLRPALGGLLLGYPTLYPLFGALPNVGPRVAVTMFESTCLPEGWAAALNQLDAVIVPSRWCAQVFTANGVTVPVHVLPLGVSKAFLCPAERTAPRQDDPFVFVTIGDRGLRKGWQEAAWAFVRAFGDDPRYRLLIKAREFPARVGNHNIEIIADDYSDAQMAALYRRAHVMLFPTAAEGFGLPPREFAGTGGVALATDWGGTADDLRQWGVPLTISGLVPAWTDHARFAGLGEWAAVDLEALVARMQHVVANYEAYAARGMVAARFVRAYYDWHAFAWQVWRIWEDVIEEWHDARDRSRAHAPAPTA